MLIGLKMFQIGDQLVVSWFFKKVVMLVRRTKNNQQLHYQARKQNIEVQQSLYVQKSSYKNNFQIWGNQWMLLLSLILKTSVP
jgi:hypothetical protein